MRNINIDLFFNPELMDEVAFQVSSSDGSALSAQDILDAVSECLLHEYNNHDIAPEPYYDA